MAIKAPGVSPTRSEFPMGESWIARHRTCINFLFRNIYLYMCVKNLMKIVDLNLKKARRVMWEVQRRKRKGKMK